MNKPQISYAHQSDPTGSRFHQYKEDLVPSWAVDVRDEEEMCNAHGLPVHPTDDYVHWTEPDPVAKMKVLRKIYARIIDAGADPADLKELLVTAYNAGGDDEHDYNSDL